MLTVMAFARASPKRLETNAINQYMKKAQIQIIAEKISSTIRVLELLGLEYEVSGPKYKRKKGNKSPRVVYVLRRGSLFLRVYNSMGGYTWANKADGTPVAQIGSIEDLNVKR
jgi:hypothetical protein